jgi:hypothetical protein
MENVKKNIHFIALGVGVLLGAIFLGVGMMIRGGAEQSLDTHSSQLTGAGTVYSDGDLDRVRQRRTQFDSSFDDAKRMLEGTVGQSLISGVDAGLNPTTFSSDMAPKRLREVRERFEAMEGELNWPDELEGWQLATPTGRQETVWGRLDGLMANTTQDNVRAYQLHLRVLEEICTTAERLMQTGLYASGFRLVNITFEAMAFPDRDQASAPWEALPFQLDLLAMPDFASALMSELARPTPVTTEGRGLFPIELVAAQWETQARPFAGRYDIPPERRAEFNVAADYDPNTDPARREATRIARQLQDQVQLVLPSRVGMKFQARLFNSNWRALGAQDGQ